MLFIRFILAVVVALIMGKIIKLLKLPAILGWLIAGMIMGPHAIQLISLDMMDASWYQIMMNIFEAGVGCLLGSELIIRQLKKSGKQIMITTLFQSIGTFLFVTVIFGIVFYIVGIPLYVAVLIGGIALATAPAPALSIVQEYQTKGPVSSTLIPMAVLDDVVAIIIFFSITSILSAMKTEQSSSLLMTLIGMIILPLIVGGAIGYLTSFFLRTKQSRNLSIVTVFLGVLVSASIGMYINTVMIGEPLLNFMLIGMAYSATFSNLVSQERLEEILDSIQGMIGLFLLMVILNLGAPLDYHLILGAGLFTAIYIISRAFGKYFGANIGARVTNLPVTVQKYLGFTLLPHSGVSLVFTGIAVSTLNQFDPSSAIVIQGTIAAAAIINEIIAVIIAKKAFEWAGEIQQK